jgi:hypothetical protein
MPGGRHKFEFVGTEPPAFRIVVALLFVNTVLMIALHLDNAKYVLREHFPSTVSWYLGHSVAVQFILLFLLAASLVAFRKRIRWVR